MKTLLITGSEGNIGVYLIEAARRQFPDWKIVRVSRRELTDPEHPSEVLVQGDLRDPLFVTELFSQQRIDFVIHTAARPYLASELKADPYGIFADDTRCLLNVLDAAKQVQKIVLLSSATVYESSSSVPFTEGLTDQIPPPLSPIGMSKLAQERALAFFQQQTGIQTTVWRLFNVVSPREDHRQPGAHVYVDFFRKLFIDHVPVLEMFGDGRQVRCFSWVEDVAEAIIRFLPDARTDGKIFNLGSSEERSLRDLQETLLEIGHRLGALPVEYQPTVQLGTAFFGVEAPKRIPSLVRVEQELGWKATTSFHALFEQFIRTKLNI